MARSAFPSILDSPAFSRVRARRRCGSAGEVLRDGSVLLGAILILNAWAAAHDPGWLRLNPTPWVLLPAFLGARYGLKAGLAGALTAGFVTITWGERALTGQGEFMRHHPFYFVSMAGLAAAAGFAQSMVSRKGERAILEAEELKRELHTVRASARLLRQDRDQLEASLLKHDASFADLPEDLARLAAAGPGEWSREFLKLLRRRFGVRGAAVYEANPAGEMSLAAGSGGADLFPSRVAPESVSPIVKAALKSGQMVSCRHLWEEMAGRPGEELAAFPEPSGEEERARMILVVKRMDFDQIHWDNLARIEALWHWVLSLAEGAVSAAGDLETLYRRRLNLASTLEDMFALGFRVLRFKSEGLEEHRWREFLRFAGKKLRGGDAMSVTPGEPGVARVLVVLRERVQPEDLAACWLEGWPHGGVTMTAHRVKHD